VTLHAPGYTNNVQVAALRSPALEASDTGGRSASEPECGVCAVWIRACWREIGTARGKEARAASLLAPLNSSIMASSDDLVTRTRRWKKMYGC
jgi:hypothetical protein